MLVAGLIAGALLGLALAPTLPDRRSDGLPASPAIATDQDAPPEASPDRIRIGPRSGLAGAYRAHLVAVVDGDTIEARVHVWLGQEVITRVRLLGIDAPEISGTCGSERLQAIAARDRLAALLGQAPLVLVDLRPDKYFGRVVARVLTGAGEDAGAALLREGLARPYAGGRRQAWCALPP
jgi:endonuclease YncB( thermonuclease family)